MNKTNLIVFVLTLSLSLAMPVMAKGSKQQGRKSGGQVAQVSAILTIDEQDTLLWMREEEKVARDVYLALYRTWRQRIFNNIAASEQKHMDAILTKLDQFGLEDPALPGFGQFNNQELQALFDDLVVDGKQSYVDALMVGAAIEDRDIYDLMQAIEYTDNLALQNTYQNLLEASKNHMRAFVGQLRNLNLDYERTFISSALFDAIMGV